MKPSSLFYGHSQPSSPAPHAQVAEQEAYLEYLRSQGRLGTGSEASALDALIGHHPKMLEIKKMITQVAQSDAPILITGESGTGKEVVAKCVHQASLRAGERFVGMNCAAVPPTLLESELFGFERGSFTGADKRHAGKFEQAQGGTLLLDEITETDNALQAKLLRVLQEKEVERIGSDRPTPINVRIIATSNRDITREVQKGRFRSDLYYRLYVVHLDLPSLRERKQDIELLARHFLKKHPHPRFGLDVGLSHCALQRLYDHNWPGNVRELENTLQRASLMIDQPQITATDLPIETSARTINDHWIEYLPVGKQMREVEMQFIIATLEHHNGNRTHAAKTLGISLRTLRNKINEFAALGVKVIGPSHGQKVA